MGAACRPIGVLGFLVLFLWTTGISASTAQISTTLTFDENDLSIERVSGFDVVRLAGLGSASDVGRPELPLAVVRFALPQGMRAADAKGTVLSSTAIPGEYLVRPVQPQVPLSRPDLARWVEPEPSVYASDAAYPRVSCALLDNGTIAGQPVASVAVYPIAFVPATGRLALSGAIRVTLTLAADADGARGLAARSPVASRHLAERLRALVVNPEDVATASSLRGDRDLVEYLIITNAAYQPLLQPLADWKSQKGMSAGIVTTSWIYANYGGVDNPAQIRNCIIDYYENHGTTWVLLAGDTDIVPARVVHAMTSGAGDDRIRCDLYYADVDGHWNADGDDTWGEVGIDDVDMYADLYVGRAPVNTTAEASRFVSKVLAYEGAPGASLLTDYQLRMLFLAEVLWDSPFTDGGVCKDMIDDESIPGQFDPITKLYETNGQLTKSRTIARLNEGQNISNHVGHANYNVMSIGSSSLYNSDFDGLTNSSRRGIMYSLGCWPAAIDYDCIAEHWMNATGAGVAFVGNSRFGWGSPGNPGNGTSDLFDREFFNQLMNEGWDQIGVAHAAHKDVFAAQAVMDGYTRYCLYELNLLGDPEMRVWLRTPAAATVNHPETVPLGEHPFLVTVSRDGAPVPSALVYVSGPGVSEAALTGPDGVALLYPSPSAVDPLTLTVTGQGIVPITDTVPVVNEPPDIVSPEAVTTLTAGDPFDLGGVIELDWAGYVPPTDFACYRVYRETAPFEDVSSLVPIVTGILDPSVMQWSDGTVEDGVSYYYAVTAVDLCANENSIVRSMGPVASTNNARILLWDADDGDKPFDGIGDDYSLEDGTEAPWVEALDAIGELYTLSTTLPPSLDNFDLVVYLGGVVNFVAGGMNVPMTESELAALTEFTDAGGSVYVEEPNFGSKYFTNGTPASIALWSRFHATHVPGETRGTGNVESVAAADGALTEPMFFPYDYQGWPDQLVGEIGPNGDEGSSLLWMDAAVKERGSRFVDPSSGAHRYMVPVLLGGMTDGDYPSTREEYVARILEDLDLIGTSGVEEPATAFVNRLDQNVPNPFNPTTTLSYSVAREGTPVRLAIYDVAGRLVTILADGPASAGEHAARWNGTDGRGTPVGSGVYFARLSIGGWTATRKVALLK